MACLAPKVRKQTNELLFSALASDRQDKIALTHLITMARADDIAHVHQEDVDPLVQASALNF